MEALIPQDTKIPKNTQKDQIQHTKVMGALTLGIQLSLSNYPLSPSLTPLDRVPEGACQESHQTIVPCSLPQQLPSTPGLFSSLKLHPSGFQGTDKASAHPPGLLMFFQGLHNFLLLFPKKTPLGRAGSWAEKLCQCPECIKLI